jgi:hypothetical protein
MDRLMGKIKWFSSRLNGGALTNIGGESLEFTSPEAVEATPFTDGQVVTYRPRGDGTTRPYADDVRAQPE